MAHIDLFIRDTIWSYILPLGLLSLLILRLKEIREWYYEKYVKPFCELHDELIEPIKKALFADLSEIDSNIIDLKNKGLIRILEIGVGSGSNLKYYPQQCRLVVVDPTEYFKEYFRDNIDKFPDVTLEKFVVSPGERLRGVPSCSVDVVVTTTVLCCVESVPKVLKEIRRVLVPGGHYYFLEHVLAPQDSKTWRLQKLANWTGLWKWLHDGCEFRAIDKDIALAGFKEIDINSFSLDNEVENNNSKLISMVSTHVVGVAIK